MSSEEEKAKSKSVSLLPSLWAQVEAKAEAEFGGNRSDYIRGLIERDLAGRPATPDALSPTILEDLCKALRPELVEILRERIGPSRQVRTLAHLLEMLHDYAVSGGVFELAAADAVILGPTRMQLPDILLQWSRSWEDWVEGPDGADENCERTAAALRHLHTEAKKDFSRHKPPSGAPIAMAGRRPSENGNDTPGPTVSPAESISAVSKKLRENPVRPTQPTPAKQ